MGTGKFTLVLGGIRSGKSNFAQELAVKNGMGPTVYLATAIPTDGEMGRRIRNHRESRPSHWRTVEAPYGADKEMVNLCKKRRTIIWDCVGLFISNLLIAMEDDKEDPDSIEKEIMGRMKYTLSKIMESPAEVIAVSNEVGMSLVSPYPLGRIYTDIIGRVNQFLAMEAHEVYYLAAGIPIKIKGSDKAR